MTQILGYHDWVPDIVAFVLIGAGLLVAIAAYGLTYTIDIKPGEPKQRGGT